MLDALQDILPAGRYRSHDSMSLSQKDRAVLLTPGEEEGRSSSQGTQPAVSMFRCCVHPPSNRMEYKHQRCIWRLP